MAVDWTPEERDEVDAAMQRFPVESGHYVPLARVVLRVGRMRDQAARSLHVRPKSPARYVKPKRQLPSVWYTHTYVEAHGHAVDALPSAEGCESSNYLTEFWRYVDALEISPIDVDTLDPGIQDEP